MTPRERLAIIAALVPRSGSSLESFFRAHDLGGAYRQSGQAAGKEQKINDALNAVTKRGDADDVLLDAVRHFALADTENPEPVRIQPDIRDVPLDLLRVDRLHPAIKAACGDYVRDGHSGAAILEAFKVVEERVRKLSGISGRTGKDLMAQAFRTESPAVPLNYGETDSDRNEQEGFMLIFMGAMQGIRNPKAHDPFGPLQSDRAFEYLAVASLLMGRLDNAETGPMQAE